MPSYTSTRTTGMVEVKGLVEGIRALGVFDERTIRGLIEAPMRSALERVAVPAIRTAAPTGPAPHTSAARGTRGRRGPLSRNVTVKKAKRRDRRNYTEITALTVGPRAWYRHFVIQGTAPHSLAKGARRSSGLLQNVPPIHPGARANNFVEEAIKPLGPALTAQLGSTPMAAFKRALGKRVVI